MAKPNDTPIAPASTNPNSSTNRSTPLAPELIALLKSLLARQENTSPAPKPPKHCRPPRIKPRRRITVGAGGNPAIAPDIPWIRLCGRWLDVAGFGVHTRVRIHVGHELVILIPEDSELNLH